MNFLYANIGSTEHYDQRTNSADIDVRRFWIFADRNVTLIYYSMYIYRSYINGHLLDVV